MSDGTRARLPSPSQFGREIVALGGRLWAKIESRDGRCYAVTELLERWELEELLEVYARPPDDPSYRDL